jgi:type VI secretion system secreted protein VgrG
MTPVLVERPLQLATPLGPDEMVLVSLKGCEAISEWFWFDLEMISENHSIKASQVIAQPFTVRIEGNQGSRYINGFVSEFSLLSEYEGWTRYRARIVPWLWFLTRATDCAIYQKKSVPEIIEAVFSKYGLRRYKLNLARDYPQREYCVQYRETACAFVMRLMEEEGICFYFEHDAKEHTLVLADEPWNHPRCALKEAIHWEPAAGHSVLRDENYAFEWVRRCEVKPRQWVQADYDFLKPHFHLTATSPTKSSLPAPAFERYDYPGRFENSDEAERLTRLRMEEDEAASDVISAESYCRALAPGYRFQLDGHFRKDQNGEYLITAVAHEAEQSGVYSGGEVSETKYLNRFTCIPYPAPFRPPRNTPRPVIPGPQTAFVTGPRGEEIYTDEHGRVKVQFHWDRRGAYDENSSCWLRVSQSSAGNGWGAMQLPRVGQEVIVEFLDGDPDRPLITGRVYNGAQSPPYELPAQKTKSTLKTMSTPGGGGFNELRFEDAKGSEQIFLHAERNLDVRVRKDQFTTVLGDRHAITEGSEMVKVAGDRHLTVTGDQNLKVGGTISVDAEADWQQKVGSNFGAQAGSEIHLKAGMNVMIESGTTLTLKAGGNFINISPAGIFIKGNMVMINSGGAPGQGIEITPGAPVQPREADTAKPGDKAKLPKPKRPPKPVVWNPFALMMKRAQANGTPFCEAGCPECDRAKGAKNE